MSVKEPPQETTGPSRSSHTDFTEFRGDSFEAKIPGRKVELFHKTRVVGDMHFAIDARGASIRI